MKVKEEYREIPSFEITESDPINEFSNIIFGGYILSATLFFIYFLKYLIEGNTMFSIVTFVFSIILIHSIYTAIKLTGSKKIQLLENGMQIEYVKFRKLRIRKFINWEDVVSFEIIKNEHYTSHNERSRITLNLNNNSIVLSNNVSKEVAIRIKEAINLELENLIQQ